MNVQYHYSGNNPLAVLGVIALVIAGIAVTIVPFIVHIVVCVKANWAAMLIIGLVIPPVGWVHGAGIILGVWG
jgi:hypothetical protein